MGKVVMVVDDDADIRDLMTAMLEDEGYAVVEACDGEDALERLERSEGAAVDAIILDYAMPRCDGEEFARRFHERYDRVSPIILLTASQQLEERCRRVDADECVGKPFDVNKLLDAVGRQTRQHG